MPYLRLKAIHQIELYGKSKTLYPGDWFNFGGQEAARLLAEGKAEDPAKQVVHQLPFDCGVVVEQPLTQEQLLGFDFSIQSLGNLPYRYNCLWDAQVLLNQSLYTTGMNLLKTWQLAVPLFDYKVLAKDIGSDDERAITQAVIHDLRVPVYDTRLMFVRRCEETKTLMSAWVQEQHALGDRRLAFLRALYAVKPLILALPFSWTTGGDDGFDAL